MDLHHEGPFVIEDACFRLSATAFCLAVIAAIRLRASCAYLKVARRNQALSCRACSRVAIARRRAASSLLSDLSRTSPSAVITADARLIQRAQAAGLGSLVQSL